MPNPIKKPVAIKLHGVDYTLMFDFDAVAAAEDISGRPLLTGLSPKDVTSPTISLVRAMLFASLLPTQPDTTFSEAKALVTRDNLVEIWIKVLEAWNNSNPDPEPASENPIQGQS
jgi:hypothetical protein